MRRIRAQALALVNWRGVFYERYLIDRHVTALEGDNGAGKTTVMIAAYVVLLPDMSRLRFMNIGESGATGGDRGIWGRLGEPGRPSYSAIEFRLANGDRLLAGIHLLKRGEPSVVPTPFLIRGLARDIPLHEVLVLTEDETESVPELNELRENATRLGGHFKSYATAREYFSDLFDCGVAPLRLASDRERSKLNALLKTSMTGGISHALTSELRSFLLRAEPGLAGTLQRMKANLSACRRTRTEVRESQVLRREIRDVFDTGAAMFRASLHAAAGQVRQAQDALAAAESDRDKARSDRDARERRLKALESELDSVRARDRRLGAQLEEARELSLRLREALAAAKDRAKHGRTYDEARRRCQEAAREEARLERLLRDRQAQLAKAKERYDRASEGVSRVQEGLKELHFRAALHKQVVRRKQDAGRLLGREIVAAEQVGAAEQRCREELREVDQRRRDCEVQISDADELRRRQQAATHAVQVMADEPVPEESLYRAARELLQRHRDLEILAQQVERTATELAEVRARAERQARVRTRIAELGVEAGDEPFGERIRAILKRLEAKREALTQQEATLRAELEREERVIERAAGEQERLRGLIPVWNELDEMARRVGTHVSHLLDTREDLDRARETIAADLKRSERLVEQLGERVDRARTEARDLLAGGGFGRDLLRLRDELEGDLLASRFDDLEVEEAGVVEAVLGSLRDAIVVDHPQKAAHEVQTRPKELASVWLVKGGGINVDVDGNAGDYRVGDRDVAVPEGEALRVSRIPASPRLGLKAREQRAAELRSEADTAAEELDRAGVRRRRLERQWADSEELLAGHALWRGGDPQVELASVRERIARSQVAVRAHRRDIRRIATENEALSPRMERLRAVLADARIADPPDYSERAKVCERDLERATAAQAEVKRCASSAKELYETMESLRFRALTDSELGALQIEAKDLRDHRDRLAAAIEALEYVNENRGALAWSDAANALERQERLVPRLIEQRNQAEIENQKAQRREDDASGSLRDAVGHRKAQANRMELAREQIEEAAKRLAQTGIDGPTPEAAKANQTAIRRLRKEKGETEGLSSRLERKVGSCETDCRHASEALEKAEGRFDTRRREAEPLTEGWARLSAEVGRRKLGTDTGPPGQTGAAPNDVEQQRQLAQRREGRLKELLRKASGAEHLLELFPNSPGRSSLDYCWSSLKIWTSARNWLMGRLPAQLAEVDDPHEGLQRLQDQLERLEARLERQESDLRGSSEDIQRGIEVQIRRARTQVRRLNRDLGGVGFGGIAQIQVRLENDESMEQVLRALRERDVQTMLFSEELPLEEALERIFSRWGRGKSGTQRVLDYREYIKLQVQVRRKGGLEFESARPTRLSTGEAIGVGAALMMVVLTAWERDANLLRRKRSFGSLRFLFLDEASRLSQNNLSVLFDLCNALDLQLMIASPEVAKAQGNTTYRLVRTTEGGREEVKVSGRRLVARE